MSLLDDWFGPKRPPYDPETDPDNQWSLLDSMSEEEVEANRKALEAEYAKRAANFVIRNGLRVLIISATTGIAMAGMNKLGLEIGFPVACCTITATEAGRMALMAAIRARQKSKDGQGVSYIKR